MLMQILTELLSSGWQWIVAGAGVIIALFSVRKVAVVKTKAAAEVSAAKVETEQANARVENIKVAQNARKDIGELSDHDVDDRLRTKYRRQGG